jgi:hypothetical protein
MKQQPIVIQIKRRQWRWIGQTPRKPTRSIEKLILDWNPQGAWWRGRPKNTWKKTVKEEIMEVAKTWSKVKRIAVNRIRWKHFMDALCSRGSNRN